MLNCVVKQARSRLGPKISKLSYEINFTMSICLTANLQMLSYYMAWWSALGVTSDILCLARKGDLIARLCAFRVVVSPTVSFLVEWFVSIVTR